MRVEFEFIFETWLSIDTSVPGNQLPRARGTNVKELQVNAGTTYLGALPTSRDAFSWSASLGNENFSAGHLTLDALGIYISAHFLLSSR